jgi:GTP-binding protein Era
VENKNQNQENATPFRAGFLGIIVQPNAGKSTLMNFLVQEKVSIVSDKPQTTRRRIIGMSNLDQGQIIFVDAPGIVRAEKGLNGFLALEAKDVIDQSDALVAVLSLDEKRPEDLEKVLEMVTASKKPWLAVITKTDLVEKAHRLPILRQMIQDKGGKVFTLANLHKPNAQAEAAAEAVASSESLLASPSLTQELLQTMLELLPVSPAPLYDADLFTTESVRDLTIEIIREKCFESLHMEIPYSLAVRIIKFDEEASPCPKIYAEILVAKENHKSIVIGKGGEVLKNIGTLARKEIEELMGEKVYLNITVNFKKDWFANKGIMKELRYVTENN